MPSFSSTDVLDAVDRRLCDVARAASAIEQAVSITEAVMWLWMLADTFNALQAVNGHDRDRLNGLLFARHNGLHEAVQLAELKDVYSDHYTEMYGAPTWALLPPAKPTRKHKTEESDYKEILEGRVVIESLTLLVAALRRAEAQLSWVT